MKYNQKNKKKERNNITKKEEKIKENSSKTRKYDKIIIIKIIKSNMKKIQFRIIRKIMKMYVYVQSNHKKRKYLKNKKQIMIN